MASKRHRYTHTLIIFIAVSFIVPIRLHLTFVEVVRRVCVIEFSIARTNVWVFRDLNVSSGSRHGRFSWSTMNQPRVTKPRCYTSRDSYQSFDYLPNNSYCRLRIYHVFVHFCVPVSSRSFSEEFSGNLFLFCLEMLRC